MTTQPTSCNPKWIPLFLRHQLSVAEQTEFETHLEQCALCRQTLESEAAGVEVWADVRDSLSSDDWPLSPSGVMARGGATEDLSGGAEEVVPFDSMRKLLAPSDDPRMLGRLGPYEILGVVGQGGMGIVFKGLDPALNRYVAIKALAPHLAASGSARQRFAREAQAAAAVTHENVVAIHGVAEWNGWPYLVMPYVRGESLQRRLDEQGPLGLHEVLRVGRQVAAGLAAAHAQGLVHRDIKPANILLEDGVERLKITDFGLARAIDDASITRTGVIAGTPQYMSPEQARGESLDARSDLFSLGSVLYAMAAGRPPFRAETSYGILRRITDDVPRDLREINPDVPEWLAAIIDRLLAKEPAERFASTQEVAALLEQCLAHVQHPTAIPLPVFRRYQTPTFEAGAETYQVSAASRLATRAGRRWWMVVAGAGLIALGAGIANQFHRGTPAESLGDHSNALPEKPGVPLSSQPKPATPTAPQDVPESAWNAISEPLTDLMREESLLEARVERFWDRQPRPPDAPQFTDLDPDPDSSPMAPSTTD